MDSNFKFVLGVGALAFAGFYGWRWYQSQKPATSNGPAGSGGGSFPPNGGAGRDFPPTGWAGGMAGPGVVDGEYGPLTETQAREVNATRGASSLNF